MKFFNKILVFSFLIPLLLLAACGDSSSDEKSSDTKEEKVDTIKIGMNNWAENVAVSNMWKILLEEKGYEVSLVPVDKAVLYEGLASDDLDIGMEIWLPTTDGAFYEQYKEEIDWRDVWYEGTELALTVPAYMEDINSIEDLQENRELFNSEIYGIDPGSSIVTITEEQIIPEYGLDFELLASSEPSMITELQKRLDNEEPIVTTLWKPHWVFAEMDLKILEDPKNIYGDSENISYAARLGLEEDHPEVVKWFDNFIVNDDQLGTLMKAVQDADSEAAGAQKWIDDNRDVVEGWFE